MTTPMPEKHLIQIKRVYDLREPDDGHRVLVDRLWPRGVKKADVELDGWAKDLAPSTELRQWFDHQEKRFAEFRIRYVKELRVKSAAATALLAEADSPVITLLYAARSRTCNHPIVLQEFLTKLELISNL